MASSSVDATETDSDLDVVDDEDPVSMYSLPNELLCMIVQSAYEHDPDRCYLETPSELDDPITIAHVSQRFRDVAFGIPSIWSCVHIDVDHPETLHQPKFMWLLDRAEPLQISVHFRCMELQRDPRAVIQSPTFPLWMRGERWKSCTITTACPPLIEPITGLLRMFPNLETIQIEPALPDLQFPVMAFERESESLKCLRIRQMFVRMNSPLLQNLHTLVLCDHNVSVHYLRGVIESAPHLTHLTLDNVSVEMLDDDETVDALLSPIEFPTLRTLVLHHSWFCLEWLLARIVAPDLETFELAYRDHALSPGLPPNWFTQTPSLRHLRIVADDMVGTSIHDIEHLTSSITTLDLTDTLADDVLKMLVTPESWMPRLSTLTLTRLDDASLLMKLINQRRRAGHPITELALGKPLEDEMDKGTLEWLQPLVRVTSAVPTPMPRYWLRPPQPGIGYGPPGIQGEGEVDAAEEDEDEDEDEDDGDEQGEEGEEVDLNEGDGPVAVEETEEPDAEPDIQ